MTVMKDVFTLDFFFFIYFFLGEGGEGGFRYTLLPIKFE